MVKISVAIHECIIEALENAWKAKSKNMKESVWKICDEIEIVIGK